MIHELSYAIASWSARHGGRYPARIRVAPWVTSRINDDADEMSLKRDPSGTGVTKIMGVEIVEDEKLFFAEADA